MTSSRFQECSLILLILLTSNILPADSASSEELSNITLRLYMGKTFEDNFTDVFMGDAVKLLKIMDLKKPTVVYIHGFSENLQRTSVKLIISAYLERQDHNVLALDYSEIAKKIYPFSATSAPEVGKVLAKALNDMVSNSLNPERLHVVGHSLGGQVAGYVGRNVDFKLSRITALDPAGPGFYIIINHLKSTDAEFVVVIHTDAGIYGIAVKSGHVDFYPNGGTRIQPGCPNIFWPSDDNDYCSHHRSWHFYAESVTNEKAFISVECEDYSKFKSKKCKNNKKIIMGLGTPIGINGTFYLETNDKSPFGKGEDGVNPIPAKSIIDSFL